MNANRNWPELNFSDIQDTLETLHQWIQIVGKIRLRAMPWQNHSWHSTLYISSSGFTTNNIPYQGKSFEIKFDFKRHALIVECSHAESEEMELKPMTVAQFYSDLFGLLESKDIQVKIHGSPNEVDPAIPFNENTINKDYSPVAANAIWRSMQRVHAVFSTFRGRFIGKGSPVQIFWGAFDLATSRFSGAPAPLHPGGMPNMPLDVMQESYSKEVNSVGFWPGSKDSPTPVFYAYIYPGNDNYAEQKVMPKEAFYSPEMGEFFLKYEDVRNADDPEKTLMDFCQSTYEAGAKTAGWDRAALER